MASPVPDSPLDDLADRADRELADAQRVSPAAAAGVPAVGDAVRPRRGRLLTASVRLPRSPVEWTPEQGPMFGNTLGSLVLDGSRAELTLCRTLLREGAPELVDASRRRLDRPVPGSP
jgi:hypothetical protein